MTPGNTCFNLHDNSILWRMRYAPLTLTVFLFGCTPEMPPDGHVWSVDTTAATWHEPAGAQALVETMASSYPFYVGAWESTGNQLTLMLAIADGGGQDFCSRTVLMPEMRVYRDQRFQFGPADYTIANGFTIEDFEMAGTFSTDFEAMNDITFHGNLNMSTAPPDMLPGSGDMPACELAESFNLFCNDCRDGSAECLQSHATGTFATRAAEISLIEISDADCHDQCEASAENPECE